MTSLAAKAVQESNSQLRRKNAVPKGTTDIVMDRLFPKKRSTVPIDNERKSAVYAILQQVGAIKDETSDEQGSTENTQYEEGQKVLDGTCKEDLGN